LRPEADVVVSDRENDEIRWFTFAGGMINTAFSDVIQEQGFDKVVASDFYLRVTGTTDGRNLSEAVRSMEIATIRSIFEIFPEFLDKLKFNECLPNDLAEENLKARLLNVQDVQRSLSQSVVEVVE
jgi:NH3-dependent NAD+ synthetase